jgi:hypothetical protein
VTNPSGLGSLKKRFGDDDEGNVFGLRTELLIGLKLAEAGIPFRFGGRAEPDVKCELTPEIWIEARTRSRDDVLLLQRDLRVALGNSPVNAILSFERRLAVSERERNAIIRRVLEAVESRGTAHSISVHLPEIEGTCGIEPSLFGTPSVLLGAVTSNLGVGGQLRSRTGLLMAASTSSRDSDVATRTRSLSTSRSVSRQWADDLTDSRRRRHPGSNPTHPQLGAASHRVEVGAAKQSNASQRLHRPRMSGRQ